MDEIIPPAPPDKPTPWLKISLIIIGALVVLGLFANLYLLARNQKPVAETNPTPTSIPTVYTEDSRSANWKIYEDEKLGFLIKLPSGWEFGHGGGEKSIMIRDRGLVTVSLGESEFWEVPNPKRAIDIEFFDLTNQDHKEMFNDQLDTAKSKQIIQIGGREFKKWESVKLITGGPMTCPITSPTIATFWTLEEKGRGAKFLVGDSLKCPEPSEMEDDFIRLLLSTFKFLDQNSADPTASWETYTSGNGEFTFKYPKQYVVKDEGSGLTVLYNNSSGGKIKKIDIYKNFLGGWGCVVGISSENITVSGINTKLDVLAGGLAEDNCSVEDPKSGRMSIVTLTRDNIIWLFELTIDRTQESQDLATFKQILSTFKFLQ